jgi:hypothetical protein
MAGGFFGVDGPVGYILIAITAEGQFDTYSAQYDAIFETFVPGELVTTYVGENNAAPQPKQPSTSSTNTLPETGQSNPSVDQGLVLEAHPELGFEIEHKDDWIVERPNGYSVRIGLGTIPEDARPSIVVEALSGDAYLTLQAAAEDLKMQLTDFPSVQFDQEGPHRIDTLTENDVPLDGWSFGAIYTVNSTPFRQLTFIFKRQQPSMYYTVYVTGPAATLPQYQADMMRVLATLTMVPFEN